MHQNHTNMKQTIIGTLVGGLLLFIWQFLSWAILDLHRPAQDYTPKQDSILSYLNQHLEKEGGYFLPTVPKGSSADEMQALEKEMTGKPWATIQYHSSYDANMTSNMVRALAVNIVILMLLLRIIQKLTTQTFMEIFALCFLTGIIVFLNTAYTSHIWYKLFDIRAFLIDSLVMWPLVGLWLGWWMGRKTA